MLDALHEVRSSVDGAQYPLTQFGHVRFARITEPRTILIAALAQPPFALIAPARTVVTHNPSTCSAVVLPSAAVEDNRAYMTREGVLVRLPVTEDFGPECLAWGGRKLMCRSAVAVFPSTIAIANIRVLSVVFRRCLVGVAADLRTANRRAAVFFALCTRNPHARRAA